MKKFLGLLFVLAFASCSKTPYLSVQTSYFTRESLASYYVETPDPLLVNPPVEQKLLINWAFPHDYLDYKDLHLNVRVRFRNREEVSLEIPLEKASGYYMYVIETERFFETRGILTYKVDLIGGGCILEEWRHQLWHELIRVGDVNDISKN